MHHYFFSNMTNEKITVRLMVREIRHKHYSKLPECYSMCALSILFIQPTLFKWHHTAPGN